MRRLPTPKAAIAATLGALSALGLVVTPESLLVGVGVGTLAILATLHGLGRIVGRVTGDDDAPFALAVSWGFAAWIAIAGPLLALGWFGPNVRIVIAAVGCAGGAAWLAWRGPSLITAPPASAVSLVRLVAAAIAIGLSLLYVFGAAGRIEAPFVDAELGGLDQLRRLDDTGGLADPIGFPRAVGLGGHLAASSLAGMIGELRTAHLVDRGVAFAIAVAVAMMLVRSPWGRFAALVAPLLASAAPDLAGDFAPSWTIVALVLATWATLERAQQRSSSRLALAAIGLAAALATVRHGGVPFAAIVGVFAVMGSAETRPSWRWALGVIAVFVAPYSLSAIVAWWSGPSDAVLAGFGAPSAGGLVLWTIVGVVLAWLLHLATCARDPSDAARARPLRSVVIAATAAIAASGWLREGAFENAAPFLAAIAMVLVLAVLVAPSDPHDPCDELSPAVRRASGYPLPPVTVVIAVALVCAAVTGARYRAPTPAIPLIWPHRLAESLSDARALVRLPSANTTAAFRDHAAAFGAIPVGARVGTWTDRGDLVPHDRAAIVDLRTGPARRCARTSDASLSPRCAALVSRIRGLGLTHIIVARSAASHAVIAALSAMGGVRGESGDLQVIELARPGP